MKAEHVTLRNGKAFCTHCGNSLNIDFPIEVYLFTAMSEAFIKHHAGCKKVWQEPEISQDKTKQEKMNFWLAHGEQGVSSKTIYSVLSGQRIQDRYCHPYDPDDFKRCYLLLETIPEWKNELWKMKEVSQQWSNLVDNWDKLTEMIKEQLKTKKANGMYEFMQKLIHV